MIERPIPQDVMKYEAKLMGNLSMRQCIAVLGCALVCVPGYFLFGEQQETAILKMIFTALPAFPIYVIGFMPVMGMPAEKVAIPLLMDNCIAPAVRKKEIHDKEFF